MNKTDEDWSKEIVQFYQQAVGLTKSGKLACDKNDLDSLRADPKSIAGYIDHTLLKLDAIGPEIDKICEEAQTYGFAAVCVRPEWVSRAVNNLKSSASEGKTPIPVASVISFHEGTAPTAAKIAESISSVVAGAKELDVVLNRETMLSSPDYGYSATFAELKAIRDAAPSSSGVHLKLILETSQLSEKDIVAACVLAGEAGWDYVKTSSGFCGRGASVKDVKLMKACCEVLQTRVPMEKDDHSTQPMKIKASGGIRTYGDAIKMVEAGANRIGASSGVAIVEEASKTSAK